MSAASSASASGRDRPMELDGIAAETAGIEQFEPRRVCIRLPAPLEHVGATPTGPERRKGPAVGAARIVRNRIPQWPVGLEQVNVLETGRLVGKLGLWRGHRMPSYRCTPPPPGYMALRSESGNARTAALPPLETPPIDGTLMDIATPTPGRLNRAKRLRVLRECAHYIDVGVSATARLSLTSLTSTSAGRAETADMSNRLSSGRRDS